MGIFCDLPENKLKDVMVPHFIRSRHSFYYIFKKMNEALIRIGKYSGETFEEVWSKAILNPPQHTCLFIQNPFGFWHFNSLLNIAKVTGNSSVMSSPEFQDSVANLATEASFLLNFESNYRKVFVPSEELIAQLTSTEVTPLFSEVQLPYPCIYVRLPKPIACRGDFSFINGFYLWERGSLKFNPEVFSIAEKFFEKIGRHKEFLSQDDVNSFLIGYSCYDPTEKILTDRESIRSAGFNRNKFNGYTGEEIVGACRLEIQKFDFKHPSTGEPVTERDIAVGEWLFRLAMNLCLWLSNKQEDCEVHRSDVLENLKKAKNPLAFRIRMEQQYKGKTPVENVVLGQHVVIDDETRKASEHLQSVCTSKTAKTHWRRAHWRRVVFGTGRVGRAWRWFKHVLVNKDKGVSPSSATYDLLD